MAQLSKCEQSPPFTLYRDALAADQYERKPTLRCACGWYSPIGAKSWEDAAVAFDEHIASNASTA